MSGNHGNIDKWRLEESKKITKDRRPDLWDKYQASHREDNKKRDELERRINMENRKKLRR